jgi:hypothetical protein
MPLTPVNSGTGPAIFPDQGELSYNDITFSTLYTSALSSDILPDNAKRITKAVEWTLKVHGLVTLPENAETTDAVFLKLRQQLSVHGAALIYFGKGFGNLIVNGDAIQRDIAWGPIPKVISFKPLGGAGAAEIEWQVTTTITELPNAVSQQATGNGRGPGGVNNPVVQYNYQARVGYDDEGYSNLSLRGTLEIPMTISISGGRRPPDDVDLYRQQWMNIQFDLTKFTVTRRSFEISRDRRTIEWEFVVEELSDMGLPPGAMKARGTMSVRPMKSGNNSLLVGVQWACSLRATYTISKTFNKRCAMHAFYNLLCFRMRSSVNGAIPIIADPVPAAPVPPPVPPAAPAVPTDVGSVQWWLRMDRAQLQSFRRISPVAERQLFRQAFLMDMNFDEGIYMDAKTFSVEATWMIIIQFTSLLQATGVWRWQRGTSGDLEWATSIRNVMGAASWLENKSNIGSQVIVDLGVNPTSIGFQGPNP